MTMREHPDGSLTVAYRNAWRVLCFGAAFLASGVFLLLTAGADVMQYLVAGLFALAGVGAPLVGLERSTFTFHAGERAVRWTRAGLLRRKTGRLAFADVRAVVLVQSVHNYRASYRLALLFPGGRLQLTGQAVPRAECEAAAEAIRASLARAGHDVPFNLPSWTP